MSSPTDLRYTEQHEWARREADGAITVGVTDHAQDSLGDVVFVELPEVGDSVTQGEPFGVVESVKAVSDLYAPCSGTVAAVNENLEATPELVNAEPYGKGWLIRITPEDGDALAELMDHSAYDAFVAEEA